MLGGIAAMIVAATAAAPVALRSSPVVMLPLRSLGVDGPTARALEETLRNEIASLPESRAAPGRRVVTATASQLGDAFLVDLKLLEKEGGRELRRVTRSITGPRDALIDSMREAAVELIAPGRFVGALQIEVPGAAGALVFVDGKPAGTAPLQRPVEGLAPGSHTVRVADPRTGEVSTFVEVRYGKTTAARVDLGPVLAHAVTARPGNRWWRAAGYTGVGLGAASALTGLVYYFRASATASELNRREQLNLLLPGDAATYDRLNRDLARARLLYGIGAALAVVGAGALYWDFRSESLIVSAGPGQIAVQGRF